MRKQSKQFVKIQVAAEEGTQDVFIALDQIAFINHHECQIILNTYQEGYPTVFLPTKDSLDRLIDLLKQNRKVMN